MCGINGFLGEFPAKLVQEMNEAVSHRGPDDAGTYFDERQRIGLGHRRLSILDLTEQGRQPMWNPQETVAIVYNGEIYNYRELRSELISRGYPFRTNTDTEVLLNLYQDAGPDCLSRLNGIFAFAIWDSTSKTLFIARDGVGVKPLYYCENGSGFIFASELKALLLSPVVDRRIDLVAMSHYLAYSWCPSPRTMLASVKKLEPGHALIVRDGRVQKQWQFYELPCHNNIDMSIHETAAISRMEGLLAAAVERQLVADVEVGAFLSGGLDSSAVVALAKRAKPSEKMRCFTISYRKSDPRFARYGEVDLPYAVRVAEYLGVELNTVEVGPEICDLLPTMIYHLDEPQADLSPLNVLLISQLAKKSGIKVLLSGAGGDDILAGYRRHFAIGTERTWAWLPRRLRHVLRTMATQIPTGNLALRRAARAFHYADSEPFERIAGYFRFARPEVVTSVLAPSVLDELERNSPDPLVQALTGLRGEMPLLNKMLFLDSKYYLTDHNLNYTDKLSMAAGVETRVPILDPTVIDFVASLPPHFKQHGRTGKWVLKKAMEAILPREVIYRPKVGFGAPIRFWLSEHLTPLVDDVLSVESLQRRGIFHPRGVRHLIEQDRAGMIDGAYLILSILCIELWLRIFLDQTIRPQQTCL